jgi:putative GTP pyrophosphokinase
METYRNRLDKREYFLEVFNIDPSEFEKTGLKWDVLGEIYEDHIKNIPILYEAGQFILNNLIKIKKVHSVRFRVKDPSHLIEKIIRKKIEDPTKEYTLENYQQTVTDLIGVRALHLFKDSWITIHKYINDTWELHEPPTVYYRAGDDKKVIEKFEESGCSPKEHPFGYRSVHYIIKSRPAKKEHLAEIQVHQIRYPYETDNEILNQFLQVLNRLSGSADEMGTFIRKLQVQLKKKDKEIKEQKDIVASLNKKLEQKNISTDDLEKIREQMKEIKIPSLKFDKSILDTLRRISEQPTVSYPKKINISSYLTNEDRKSLTEKKEQGNKGTPEKPSDPN